MSATSNHFEQVGYLSFSISVLVTFAFRDNKGLLIWVFWNCTLDLIPDSYYNKTN